MKSSSARASSTSRFWSSAVSDLRVTFSVASDGEVGDLVADLLDGAARLGLDVPARLLHHLLALAPGLGEDLVLVRLAGLARAGDDVVGLAARLGEPLAVLLEQLSRPPCAMRSEASIDSSIAFWRLSSASAMRGKASFASTYSEMPKTSSVQIISPTPGVTRKLPPLVGREDDGEVTIGS